MYTIYIFFILFSVIHVKVFKPHHIFKVAFFTNFHLPCDHHIFAVWLGLQALYDVQPDFGLRGAKELHFIRQQPHLFC